jgi:hypothetical protein
LHELVAKSNVQRLANTTTAQVITFGHAGSMSLVRMEGKVI